MTRTIVITGASDGIGAVAARHLHENGDRVLLVGRSPEKTERIASAIGADYYLADFNRLEEVRRLATKLQEDTDGIDVLVNNAGGVFGERELTVDGNEKTLQVNHLGGFLLTELLLTSLTRGGSGVVVNTSSSGSRNFGNIDPTDLNNAKAYSPNKAYGDAKLANILHVKELHRRHHADGLSAVAVHPGNVATNFASDTTSWFRFMYHTPLKRLIMVSPEKGASHLTWAVNGVPGSSWQSGAYYEESKTPKRVNPQQEDPQLAAEVWNRRLAMVGLART